MSDDQSFEWNRGEKTKHFWDDEKNLPTSITTSLKYRLENPGSASFAVICDLARGLAMVMDEIEAMKKAKE